GHGLAYCGPGGQVHDTVDAVQRVHEVEEVAAPHLDARRSAIVEADRRRTLKPRRSTSLRGLSGRRGTSLGTRRRPTPTARERTRLETRHRRRPNQRHHVVPPGPQLTHDG